MLRPKSNKEAANSFCLHNRIFQRAGLDLARNRPLHQVSRFESLILGNPQTSPRRRVSSVKEDFPPRRPVDSGPASRHRSRPGRIFMQGPFLSARSKMSETLFLHDSLRIARIKTLRPAKSALVGPGSNWTCRFANPRKLSRGAFWGGRGFTGVELEHEDESEVTTSDGRRILSWGAPFDHADCGCGHPRNDLRNGPAGPTYPGDVTATGFLLERSRPERCSSPTVCASWTRNEVART